MLRSFVVNSSRSFRISPSRLARSMRIACMVAADCSRSSWSLSRRNSKSCTRLIVCALVSLSGFSNRISFPLRKSPLVMSRLLTYFDAVNNVSESMSARCAVRVLDASTGKNLDSDAARRCILALSLARADYAIVYGRLFAARRHVPINNTLVSFASGSGRRLKGSLGFVLAP